MIANSDSTILFVISLIFFILCRINIWWFGYFWVFDGESLVERQIIAFGSNFCRKEFKEKFRLIEALEQFEALCFAGLSAFGTLLAVKMD